MNRILAGLLCLVLHISAHADVRNDGSKQDTNRVINLIVSGFEIRLTDANQSIKYADQALQLSKQMNFVRGLALAYRIKGLGEFYLGNKEKSIENYLSALKYFHQVNDYVGEVNVYNNISALYQDVDFDKSLDYLNDALQLYKNENLKDKTLLASIYMNFGNTYQRKFNFTKALSSYNQSYALVPASSNLAFNTNILQNLGTVYVALGNYSKAKQLLFTANKQAKQQDQNQSIAQINLTLAEVYLAEADYLNAKKYLDEGKAYAVFLKSDRLIHFYQKDYYLLELKRKDYEKAVYYLQDLYLRDSIQHDNINSAALALYQANYRQDELKRENERITLQQKYDRNVTWSIILLAGLLSAVVAMLITNVRRKTATNNKLTELNSEILNQKDNLDRINHYLEEIIDERTKDLQIKNKKLSDYSSYLSHQIRGPIATLKGLMNLEKEGLMTQPECIDMMTQCVTDIDDKIVDMSDMLHNPQRAGI